MLKDITIKKSKLKCKDMGVQPSHWSSLLLFPCDCIPCMSERPALLTPSQPHVCATRSTSSDLSQLVSNPSVRAQSPVGALKPISQDGPGCLIKAKNVLRREKQSSRREAKNLELSRATWSTPAESQPAKQSAHCLWQTPRSSALCRPPPTSTHTVLHNCKLQGGIKQLVIVIEGTFYLQQIYFWGNFWKSLKQL